MTVITASEFIDNEQVSRGVSANASNTEGFSSWFEVNTETFRQILKIELNMHSKQNVLNVIKELEKIEGIKYAGPNYMTHLCSDGYDWSDIEMMDRSSEQWALKSNMTNAAGAWEITTGTRSIKVGIMDSGIAENPDLDDNVVGGVDYTGSGSTDDVRGHGTHVAGIIGAAGNDSNGNNVIVKGVCWNVSLVPLKISNPDGTSTNERYISAISDATNNGIHILNLSGGGENECTALAQAILNYPGLLVASTNDHSKSSDIDPLYPANYTTILSNVISVGASNQNDEIWTSSNYSEKSVDLFAPGVSILSTIPYDYTWCTKKTGTSMAAPHVTGTAALIMSVRPDMTPVEIKKCILNSVDRIPEMEGKCVSGGRLNTYEAVRLATQPQTFTGYMNDDGMADMIITRRTSDGTRAIDCYLGQRNGTFGSAITTVCTQVYNYQDPVFVGDVNGDNVTDLIVHSVVAGKRCLLVYRGNDNGTFTGASLCETNDSHDYFTTKSKFFVADVNDDDNDDFIVHTKNSSGKRMNLTYLGQTSGSFSATASIFTSTNDYKVDPVFIGDFNHDGMADMVVPHANSSGKRCLLVYKGQSSAPYFAAGVKFNSTRNHDPLQWPCQYFINDVNGDDNDDLVVHWKDANGKRNNLVYKGSSSGLQTEAVATAATSNNYVAGDQVFVGDINGDGYGDMLVQWANSNDKRNLLVYKGTSNATYATGTNYTKNETLDLTAVPSCFFSMMLMVMVEMIL